jgi:hypothetical protein
MNKYLKILVIKLEETRLKRQYEDNIKTELRQMGYQGVEWILLSQTRTPVKKVMYCMIAWKRSRES